MTSMLVPKIGIAELEHELARMCLRPSQGFPTKRRHQHILYRSLTLMLEEGRSYTEAEINACLVDWLATIGRTVETDHVALRRGLVDHGYMLRDAAGTAYRIDTARIGDYFEPETTGVDPRAVVARAAAERELRKRAHLERGRESGEG